MGYGPRACRLEWGFALLLYLEWDCIKPDPTPILHNPYDRCQAHTCMVVVVSPLRGCTMPSPSHPAWLYRNRESIRAALVNDMIGLWSNRKVVLMRSRLGSDKVITEKQIRNLPPKVKNDAYHRIMRFLRSLGKEPAQCSWSGIAVELETLLGWEIEGSARYRAINGFALVNQVDRNGLISKRDLALKRWRKQQRGDRAARFYRSYEWRKLRYETLQKHGRTCMCCGATEGEMHVDHIKPVRKFWERRLDPDNVQVLCEKCNHGKGSWDQTDFRPRKLPDNVVSITRAK